MLLEEEISGRNMTDEMAKQKYKNEERKMRIKQDKTIVNLRLRGDLLDKKNADEENKSKAVLDEKLKLEQELMDLNEDLQVLTDKRAANREDIIKMRVRNSQLDSQTKMLEIEQASLTDNNKEIQETNAELEKENTDLKKKIALTIQRIDTNDLLK